MLKFLALKVIAVLERMFSDTQQANADISKENETIELEKRFHAVQAELLRVATEFVSMTEKLAKAEAAIAQRRRRHMYTSLKLHIGPHSPSNEEAHAIAFVI